MEQVELEQFLDTGWMNGADLFYNGRIYRTECFGNDERCLAFVYSWHAAKVSKTTYVDAFTLEEENEWVKVYEHSEPTEEEARLALLKAPIFEGKSFWEVEDKIEWLEHA